MRQNSKVRTGSEFRGGVMSIRAVEDCIRATKKYTEGLGTMRKKHPIQGEEFPSKAFCKYYEVYPNIDTSCMSASDILEWLTGYTSCLDVVFKYDYRTDKASVMMRDGPKAVKELSQSIPGFSDALEKVTIDGNGGKNKATDQI